MHVHGAFLSAVILLGAACGGRSSLLTSPPALARADAAANESLDARPEGPETSVDAARDVVFLADASEPEASVDAALDVGAGSCEEGPNLEFAPVGCGATTSVWLAGPYRPTRDISVDRVELHTMGGDFAILASAGGAPGVVLYTGSVGPSPTPAWLGTAVSPPVPLLAGTEYFIANKEAYCSQASDGPEAVEYSAVDLGGPWTVSGTDNWTSRLIGTCH